MQRRYVGVIADVLRYIQLSSPPRSGQLSPESPRTIAFEDVGDSSSQALSQNFQMSLSGVT